MLAANYLRSKHFSLQAASSLAVSGIPSMSSAKLAKLSNSGTQRAQVEHSARGQAPRVRYSVSEDDSPTDPLSSGCSPSKEPSAEASSTQSMGSHAFDGYHAILLSVSLAHQSTSAPL